MSRKRRSKGGEGVEDKDAEKDKKRLRRRKNFGSQKVVLINCKVCFA
jgi:hypothetical protein